MSVCLQKESYLVPGNHGLGPERQVGLQVMGHKDEWAHECPTGRRLTLLHHHTPQLSTVMHFVQAQM